MMTERYSDELNYVVLTTDGEELWFGTYKEMADFFNVSITVLRAIREGKETKLSDKVEAIYTVVEYDEITPNREQQLLTQPLIKGQAIQVNMLDRYTNDILMTFSSVKEAMEYVGAKVSGGIYNCARGKQSSAHNYKWEIIPLHVMNEPDFTYRTTGEIKYVLTYKNKEIRFSTQKEIADHLNVSSSVVEVTLKGENTYLVKKGILLYTLADYEELEPVREHLIGEAGVKGKKRRVHMLDRYTHEILDTFDSITEAAEDVFAKNPGNISKACKTGCVAFGYKWEYAN